MGIETSFDSRLWNAVSKSYDDRNYTAVILDSIQYLGDVIRDKTGLTSDGMSLVGEAFGGSKPKLRVNRFETETDKNIQGEIEHLVRGLYKAFRNPRSHEKHVDSQGDANTVLLLVTYLLKVIGQAKSPFERTTFLQRVFDTEFVQSARYATLLANEVPVKYQFDILVEVYRDRGVGDVDKLAFMIAALWEVISEEAKTEFAAIVSDDLNTIDKSELSSMIKLFPADLWTRCSEVARIRSENLLISSIRTGQYDKGQNKCITGHLGTWSSRLLNNALLKGEFQSAVADLLNSQEDRSIDYVFHYIFVSLRSTCPTPDYHLKHALLKGLQRGDIRFKKAMEFIDYREFDPETFECTEEYSYPKWREVFADAVEKFTEKEQDDIPF